MKYPEIANILMFISGFLIAQSIIILANGMPNNEQILIDLSIYVFAVLIIYLIFNSKNSKIK